MRWIFSNIGASALRVERDADVIVPRVLEHGRLADVAWLIDAYGLPRIHRFFREVGHAEISARTQRFWRAFFGAKEERWPSVPAWRQSSSAPWID